MDDFRIFRLGEGGWVITMRGAIDDAVVDRAVKELVARREGSVIVDLMHAHLADLDALDSLVEAAGTTTTFVADRPLLDALRLIGLRRYVRTEPTLAAALG